MAVGEVTGRIKSGLDVLKEQYRTEPNWVEHEIPFDTAYCLLEIGKQPDEYDGPQRYCANRASKLKREEWRERYDDEYDHHDPRSYCATCNFHGRIIDGGPNENLESYTANLKHGMYAEDEHLQMDFNEHEQTLYDGIMEQWPEIYDWPSEDEDPARYEMLDMVASNVVRRRRAEDYIDDEGEVHMATIYDEGIEIGEEPEENPLAGEYRLLMREITQLLKELGLTPKERAQQDAREKGASAIEEISEMAASAIVDSEEEYDPSQFEDDDPTS